MDSLVRTAKAADEDPAIDAVVLAFSADPAARWTWPDPQQYLSHFPTFVRAFGGRAFAHKTAYCVDGYAGTAHRCRPVSAGQRLRLGLDATHPGLVRPGSRARLSGVDEPTEYPAL
jgi:hypothetical protein